MALALVKELCERQNISGIHEWIKEAADQRYGSWSVHCVEDCQETLYINADTGEVRLTRPPGWVKIRKNIIETRRV
jgi:hypothetical protein